MQEKKITILQQLRKFARTHWSKATVESMDHKNDLAITQKGTKQLLENLRKPRHFPRTRKRASCETSVGHFKALVGFKCFR